MPMKSCLLVQVLLFPSPKFYTNAREVSEYTVGVSTLEVMPTKTNSVEARSANASEFERPWVIRVRSAGNRVEKGRRDNFIRMNPNPVENLWQDALLDRSICERWQHRSSAFVCRLT